MYFTKPGAGFGIYTAAFLLGYYVFSQDIVIEVLKKWRFVSTLAAYFTKPGAACSPAPAEAPATIEPGINPNTSTPSVDGTSNLFLLPDMNCFAVLCCRV